MQLLHRGFISVSFVLVLGLSLGAGSAGATGIAGPGLYQLFDHGDGQLGPAYGLRVDAISKVFSVELGNADVTLFWDGGATATISGTLNENTLGGNGGVGADWTISYTLTGVSDLLTAGAGFTATGGSGTLTDPFAVDTVLTGEVNGFGFAFEFLADGHRLPGTDDLVGRGWLLPPSTTDDWLVRAALVPEPSTALLLCLGLVGLAARRR